MPATKNAPKTRPAAKAKATKKAPARKAPAKATDRDRLAASIVADRDRKGLAWAAIGEARGLTGSQLRNLYIRGNGETVGTRPKATPAKATPKGGKKAPAKGRAKTSANAGGTPAERKRARQNAAAPKRATPAKGRARKARA